MGNIFGADLPLPLLPEDVLIQILVWLPVISLLRFKSVCKSWRALIESSFFIDLHTATTFNSSSSSSSKFGSFILQTNEIPYDDDDTWLLKRTMFMLSSGSSGVGSRGTSEDDDDQVFKMENLGFPSCYKVSTSYVQTIVMVGSCNGLICLQDIELRDVSLWNPATRQFRILPKSITLEEGIGKFLKEFIVFGFDVKTKDYKVVQITCFTSRRGMECIWRVQVYSLSTNSWRLLEGINSIPAEPGQGEFINQGLYLNGSYFFVGNTLQFVRSSCFARRRCNNKLMLSYDFTKEIFTTMEFPDHNILHRMVLGCLGGKVALFITKRASSTRTDEQAYGDDCDDHDIWVLNEHAGDGVNKESWTKLHSFRKKIDGHTHPKGISNNGEFALIEARNNSEFVNKLQLFNLVTKEVKKEFAIGHAVLRADIYKQSLVSIIGGNGEAVGGAM